MSLQALIVVTAKLQVLVECMADHVDKGFFGRNGILSQCVLHNAATIGEVLSKGLCSEEIEPKLQQCRDQHVCSCLQRHEGQRDDRKDKGHMDLHALFE